MRVYWVLDRDEGEEVLLDENALCRLLGVEIDYIDWCIKQDGYFENGDYRVAIISGITRLVRREEMVCDHSFASSVLARSPV